MTLLERMLLFLKGVIEKADGCLDLILAEDVRLPASMREQTTLQRLINMRFITELAEITAAALDIEGSKIKLIPDKIRVELDRKKQQLAEKFEPAKIRVFEENLEQTLAEIEEDGGIFILQLALTKLKDPRIDPKIFFRKLERQLKTP